MLNAHKQVREVVHGLFYACLAHQQRLAEAGFCDGKLLSSPKVYDHPWQSPAQAASASQATEAPSAAQPAGGHAPGAEQAAADAQKVWS